MTYAEPERKNQIWKVDLEIREVKRRWHEKMRTRRVPKRLWDFGLKYAAKIMQLLPRNDLQGRTGYEEVTGKTQTYRNIVILTSMILSGIMPEYTPA